ncbi:sulfotransferase family 2 domain-containing protein [Nocardioides sp.]|uniref:sulfotransferase family 2 domain-containing protein n=1 Tax=Nocardioides sp. TaxID=35761 RepID=UPI003515E7C7
MIVSEERRFLFVHVQKTGGSSVSRLLLEHVPDAQRLDEQVHGGKHALMRTALRTRPDLAGHFVFGFVRDPWARLWSWHQMVHRREERVPERLQHNPFWRAVARDYADFERFVLEGPDVFRRLRTPQLDYLRFQGRRADFIGRTESLAADLDTVRDRLGLPDGVAVEHRNSARAPSDHRAQYTPAMRDRVAEVYAVDIAAFGYRFD